MHDVQIGITLLCRHRFGTPEAAPRKNEYDSDYHDSPSVHCTDTTAPKNSGRRASKPSQVVGWDQLSLTRKAAYDLSAIGATQ